jgi:hypothetical protein
MTTCAECRHFRRCQWLISATGTETQCDWIPSRFQLSRAARRERIREAAERFARRPPA